MKKKQILILVTILLVSLLVVAVAFAADNPNVSKQVSGEISINCDVEWRNTNENTTLPSEVTIELFANGTLSKSAKCSAADGWQCSFAELQKYDSKGNEIYYSAIERPIEGFMTAVYKNNINDFHFINSSITVPEVAEETDADADSDNNAGADNENKDNNNSGDQKADQKVNDNKVNDNNVNDNKDTDDDADDDDADAAGNVDSNNNNGSGEGAVDDNAGKEVPKTGDESAFLLWGLAFLTAAAGFGFLMRMKRA